MNTVLNFPAASTMTPEQALNTAQKDGFRDVLIVGYDEDGSLMIRSSRMSRMDALWLAELLKRHALGDQT